MLSINFENLNYALYLNIIFYSGLGLGMIFGFLKGFKKSLFSFITTVIYYVLFFVTIDMVVNYLWIVELPWLGSTVGSFMPVLAGITSISQAVPILIENFLGSQLGTMIVNQQFVALSTGLGIFVVKIAYTLIYFTIFFIIYKLICAIIRAIFLSTRKIDEKYASKNRLIGGVFGLLEGAISVFVTIIILGGLISVSESLVTFVPEEEVTLPVENVDLEFPRNNLYEASYSLIPISKPQKVEFVIPEELTGAIATIRELVDAYNSNFIVTTTASVKMTDADNEEIALNLYLFDSVLSFDYNPNVRDETSVPIQISLRKELSIFAELAGLVINSGITGVENINVITEDQVTEVFDDLMHSGLFTSLIPLGIEYALMVSNVPINDEYIADIYGIDWELEINKLGVVVNNMLIIADSIGVFNPEGIDIETVEIDGQLVQNFFNSMADSGLLTLAAVVAAQPLLDMAGDAIPAFITVPVDLNWQNEFIAMGSIMKEILDSGITYGAISNQDFGQIIAAAANINFSIILESELITEALINIFSGDSGFEFLDMIEIPSDIDWRGSDDIKGELQLILEALSEIAVFASGDSGFDITDPKISDISTFSETAIDALLSSRVLVATFSTLLLDMDLGEFSLVVPTDSLDENGYIKAIELERMIHAVQLVATPQVCAPEDTECLESDPDYLANVLTLTEAQTETLLASDILCATIGYLLSDMAGELAGDILVIPDIVKTSVIVSYPEEKRGQEVDIITRAELQKALLAIAVLEITSFDENSMQMGPELITKLEVTEGGSLDDDKINTLLASDILHATLSDFLLNQDLGDISIVVPNDCLDENDFISRDQIRYAVKAVYLLLINVVCDPDDDECVPGYTVNQDKALSMSDDDMEIFFASTVLTATLGKILNDMVDDPLVIPASVITTVSTGDVVVSVVTETEMRKVLLAVRVLNITDTNSLSEMGMDASLINKLKDDPADVALSQTKMEDLLASDILHATISKFIKDLSLGEVAIIMPDTILDPEDSSLILRQELYDMIQAANLLIVDNHCADGDDVCEALDDIDVNKALTMTTDQMNIFFASDILTATLGNKLNEMVGDPLVVPSSVLGSVLAGGVNVTVVTEAEMRKVLLAVQVIGITSTDDLSGLNMDASMINRLKDDSDDLELSSTKMTDLLASDIIHATVSKFITDQDLGVVSIIIPDSVIDLIEDNLIIRSEMYKMLNAINFIIIDNDCAEGDDVCEALSDFNVDQIFTLSDSQMDTMLSSEILSATIGNKIMTIGSPIIIPSSVVIEIMVNDAETNVVSATEIKKVLKSVQVIGINSTDGIGDIEFGVGLIANLKAQPTDQDLSETLVGNLLDSDIIHATVSNLITEQDLGTVTILIPDTALTAVGSGLIDREEMYYMLNAVNYIIVDHDCAVGDEVCEALSDFDIDQLFTLSDTQLDKMLGLNTYHGSLILAATMGNKIMTIGDPMVIPTSVIIEIMVEEVGVNVVSPAEIKKVLKSVQVIGIDSTDGIGSIEFDADLMNHLKTTPDDDDLSTTIVNELLASDIIHATVSDLITDQDLGTITIVIPDSALLVGTVYIDRLEMYYMLNAVNYLFVDHDCAVGDEVCEALSDFDIDQIFTLEDEQIDTMFDSVILAATMGKKINDMSGAPLIVPTSIIVSPLVDGLAVDVVEANEIKLILKAVKVLGITSTNGIENLPLDATILTTLEDPSNHDNLSDASMTTLFASVIIHATVSDMMIDLSVGAEAFIVVPSLNADSLNSSVVSYQDDDLFNFIEKQELKYVLIAMHVLKIEDFDSIESVLVLDDIIVNLATILDSSILHASISKQLIDLTGVGSDVQVPYFAEDGTTMIRIFRAETTYVVDTELSAVLNALDTLGVSQINASAFTDAVSLATIDQGTNAATVVSSAIVQATFSRIVINIALSGILDIPAVHQDDHTPLRFIVNLGADQTEYIDSTELANLLIAFKVLGYDDPSAFSDGFTGDVDLTGITEVNPNQGKTNANLLIASSIIQATISSKVMILDGDNKIVVPVHDVAENAVQIIVQDGLADEFLYISKIELENLLIALDSLGMTSGDISSFDGEISLASFYNNDSKQTTLLNSASIHATISDQIHQLDGDALTVPDTGFFHANAIEILTATSDYYIYADEVKMLINALAIIDEDGGELSFGGTFDLSILYNNDNQAILLASAIIHATISSEVLNLDGTALTVPTRHIDDGINPGVYIQELHGGFTYITDTEIDDLFTALEVLYPAGGNLSSGTLGPIDLTVLFGDDGAANQTTVLASATIHATISQQIMAMDGDEMTIPTKDVLGIQIQVTNAGTTTIYIEDFEIMSLLAALELIGFNGNLASFDGAISITPLVDGIGNDDQEQNTLLASAIMHETITQILFDLSGVMIVPKYLENNTTEVVLNNYGDDYLEKWEIKSLIAALDWMGYTDMNSMSGGIDSSKFFNSTDYTDLLGSACIRATISDRLVTSTLIIPDFDVENGDTPIRITVTYGVIEYVYVDANEIENILLALNNLGLSNIDSPDISTDILWGPEVDFAIVMGSASIQATVSDSFLEFAIVEDDRIVGNPDLVIPTIFRADIIVNGDTTTYSQITSDELINLLNALKALDFDGFDDSVSANTITDLDSTSLDIILNSASMHVTIDNMMKGNTNINTHIPDEAYVDGDPVEGTLYNITGLILASEIKAFILAAKEVGADFQSASFSYASLAGKTPQQQATILGSMIVRNIITPDLVSAVNTYNMIPGNDQYEPIPDYMYYMDDMIVHGFLNAAGIITLVNYLAS
ncbi:MAG: hypothetical protein PHT27_00945 [Candidatus Izemoplasmatales bacterium]|nr:hypothetical protein [Candidatus Izemoplasmatales bacterium]